MNLYFINIYNYIQIYILLIPLLIAQGNLIFHTSLIFMYTILFLLLLNAVNVYFYKQLTSNFIYYLMQRPIEILQVDKKPCPSPTCKSKPVYFNIY